MPKNKKDIAIYIGTFNGHQNVFTWKKEATYPTLDKALSRFKSMCKQYAGYDYSDLMKKFSSPRLDIKVLAGSRQIAWIAMNMQNIDGFKLKDSVPEEEEVKEE